MYFKKLCLFILITALPMSFISCDYLSIASADIQENTNYKKEPQFIDIKYSFNANLSNNIIKLTFKVF